MNLCIGFLELNSIAKGVEAADRILKTAETTLPRRGVRGNTTSSFPGRLRR